MLLLTTVDCKNVLFQPGRQLRFTSTKFSFHIIHLPVAGWLRFIAAAIATAAAFDIDANGVGPTVVGGVDDNAILLELAEKPCDVLNRRSKMSDESPKTVLR